MQSSNQLVIVHVITRWLKAGSEENTLLTCQHQTNAGHKVFVLHGNEFDQNYIDQNTDKATFIESEKLIHQPNLLMDFLAFVQVRRFLKELKTDVVHTHQSKAGVIGRIAAIGLGITVVHTVHIAPFLNVNSIKRMLYVGFERICASYSDAIIYVSEGMKDVYIKNRIGSNHKHHVVHSGMNLGTFENADADVDVHNQIIDNTDIKQPFIVLIIAAFEPRKRQYDLLSTIANFDLTNSNILFLLVGTGSDFERCKAYSSQLGLDNRVQFTGYVNDPENFIAASDICALCSIREGLPRVLVQYIASGKPVVATHLHGIEEIIQHGVNGIVAPEADIDEMTRKLLLIEKDKSLLLKLTDGAKSTNVSKWDATRMGKQILNIYANSKK